jgi:rRNA small subunit pseudouridine methyltransferase Nep1
VLHLFLVDAALELVPAALRAHPAVVASEKTGKTAGLVLDTALHHSAMAHLPGREHRGRPDIAHKFLLDALTSLANRAGLLRIGIHIRDGPTLEVSPAMRPPRDYARFKGLVTALLRDGRVPARGDPLAWETSPLPTLIEALPNRRVVRMTAQGRFLKCSDLFSPPLAPESHPPQNWVVLVGGYQAGESSSQIAAVPADAVSIYEGSLDSWTVINRVLVAYEQQHSLF